MVKDSPAVVPINRVKPKPERREIAERSMQSAISMAAVVGAFEAWKEMAEEKKRLRHAQGKALAKLVNRQAYAAFAAWHETKMEAQRDRYVAFKAASFLLNRCTGGALRTWREWAAEHKRQIVGVTRCLAKRKSARPLHIFPSTSDPYGAFVQ